jgi:hypothetical protein
MPVARPQVFASSAASTGGTGNWTNTATPGSAFGAGNSLLALGFGGNGALDTFTFSAPGLSFSHVASVSGPNNDTIEVFIATSLPATAPTVSLLVSGGSSTSSALVCAEFSGVTGAVAQSCTGNGVFGNQSCTFAANPTSGNAIFFGSFDSFGNAGTTTVTSGSIIAGLLAGFYNSPRGGDWEIATGAALKGSVNGGGGYQGIIGVELTASAGGSPQNAIFFALD